jgi:AAHS family 4-hydroxybenzoate transporter-like MFS transporter
MNTAPRVDIAQVIDDSKPGAFQISIFILCGICLIVDGFDVQAMGYVAPALIQGWKLQNAMMAPVFSAALAGVLIGSFVFSMLADRIGRRPVMIGATLFFGVVTLATAQADSVEELRWLRFIAGLGLGGIMPNAVALCGEFSSRSSRVLVMMLVGNGFTVGAALGGFVAAWLIPHYGWRSVFYLGGAIPLVIAFVMLAWLPESPQFLSLKGKAQARIAQTLRRLNPRLHSARAETEGAVYFVPEAAHGGASLPRLFQEGRATGTALLWTTSFMNLLNMYFLSSWLPTVMRDAGHPLETGVYVGTALQIGGVIGTILLGWLVKRFGFVSVLTTCFALASLSIALIGQPGLPLAPLFVVVFIAGAGVIGGQVGINALAGTFYPTTLRATGIGAELGAGRLGAIAGPLVGGQLMALQWNSREMFLAAAIPAVISALVMAAMRWIVK